jgi:hypothetical protein
MPSRQPAWLGDASARPAEASPSPRAPDGPARRRSKIIHVVIASDVCSREGVLRARRGVRKRVARPHGRLARPRMAGVPRLSARQGPSADRDQDPDQEPGVARTDTVLPHGEACPAPRRFSTERKTGPWTAVGHPNC